MEQNIRGSEAWTDAKHSMYIKSIEASFVNDLYDSKQTGASFSSKGKSYEPLTTGQFKVLRGGCWQKMNFERENPEMSRVNGQNDLIANPWIQHYRCSSKQESATSPTSQRNTISSKSGHLRMRESQLYNNHQNMLSSDTEVSDQNFVDEELKGEGENISNAKRRKSFDNSCKRQ